MGKNNMGQNENEDLLQDLIARMRRIEGQARGVQKMIEDGRNCEEIIMQLSAMRAAISKVALSVMAGNLERCIRPNPEDQEAIERAKKIFMKFS